MKTINSIVLIGSGNVATHFGMVFMSRGITILQVYSYHLSHAEMLAGKLGCDATDDLGHINPKADLYIIAVKDDAIYSLNNSLALSNKLVVHTSGSAPLEAINHISENTGVFYPLQTFTKNRPVGWDRLPFCIEATDAQNQETLRELAHRISGAVFDIDSAMRRKLHLAAVFANNFTNYLLGISKEIIGSDLPFNILKPLVQETLNKAFDIGPATAQTGPAMRDDKKTMEAHLKLLKNNPEAAELYGLISALIRKKNTNQ